MQRINAPDWPPDSVRAVLPASDWYGLTTLDPGRAGPYEWFMVPVVAFVFRESEPHRLVYMRGIGASGDELHEYTHFVRGMDGARGALSWSDIFRQGTADQVAPGLKNVTRLVRPIPGFEKNFRW
jgi:hypothetical protein